MKKGFLSLLLTCFVMMLVFVNPAIGVQMITTEEIAEGAVTDSKITGPISASKIQGGLFAKNTDRIILVSQNVGDFQSLYDAINYINANSSPYFSSPYLIKLAPGVHSSAYIEIPSNVTIEGSGQNSTILEGHARFDALGGISEPAVKLNGTNIELRDVTIRYRDAYNDNGFHVTTGAILLNITGDALVENVKFITDLRGLSADTRSISAKNGSVQLENITLLASTNVVGHLDMVNSSALIDGFDVIPGYSGSGAQPWFPNLTMTFDNLLRGNIIIKNSTFRHISLSNSGDWQFFDINNSEMKNLYINGSISVQLRNSQVDLIDNQGSNYPNNLKYANCFNSLFEDFVVY